VTRPRAIFFGTPEMAVPALDALVELCDVPLVVTQPDRPRGRGLRSVPTPVKARALDHGLEVVQPTKVRAPEFAESLRALRADVGVVIAYGRILPRGILDAPHLGCVNLHASLLPRWRGAAPVQWAVASGDTETGVCLMQMDEGLDTGPVLACRATPIGSDETAGEVTQRLARLAADVLRAELPAFLAGALVPMLQDEARATYARVLEKADGRLDFARPVRAVHDHARGMTPWPGAFTTLPNGSTLKVHRTRVLADTAPLGPDGRPPSPGTVVVADARGGLAVACAPGILALEEVQLEGKKRVSGRDFVAGRGVAAGAILGAPPAKDGGDVSRDRPGVAPEVILGAPPAGTRADVTAGATDAALSDRPSRTPDPREESP
jgi:methionyl-tRNA formyltransferase